VDGNQVASINSEASGLQFGDEYTNGRALQCFGSFVNENFWYRKARVGDVFRES